MAPKLLSCGVLIYNEHEEILVCHATGTQHWDIPKGALEEGETPAQAALRETSEETGLVLQAAQLREIGRVDYIPKKDLHLFSARVAKADIALDKLHCTTFFESKDGHPIPEADDYRWATEDDIRQLCSKGLAALLYRHPWPFIGHKEVA